MNNTLRIVLGVAIGLVVGRFSSLIVMVLIMTSALLVGLIAQVVAHERSTGPSQLARLSVGLGIAVLAGRLMGWFGIIGGLVALVLIAVALVMTGADIA